MIEDRPESELLTSENDRLVSRLQREAAVLLLGGAEGYVDAASDRLRNTKLQTASEFGISAALTYGLVRAGNSIPSVRYAAGLTGAALSFSFIKNIASDLTLAYRELKEVAADSWKSDNSLDANRQRVANLLGPFLFDTSIALAGGIVGGRVAHRQGSEKTLLVSMESKYGDQINQSVFTAQSRAIDGKRFYGSAYAVESDKLATAFHVVKDDPSRSWALLRNNKDRLDATVLAAHPYFDLALFKTQNGAKVSPLPLASLSDRNTTAGIIVGSPGGRGIQLKTAAFHEARLPYGAQYQTANGVESVSSFVAGVRGGNGRPGMSGGPAILETGEVVATLSSLNPSGKLIGAGTLSVPSQALQSLLKLVEKSQTPQFNLSTKEAAAKLKLSEDIVLSRLREANLPGFLVPNHKVGWEWRVVID